MGDVEGQSRLRWGDGLAGGGGVFGGLAEVKRYCWLLKKLP